MVMFGSCLVCFYCRLLKLVRSCLSKALISISGMVILGTEYLGEFALSSPSGGDPISSTCKVWTTSGGDPSSGVSSQSSPSRDETHQQSGGLYMTLSRGEAHQQNGSVVVSE